MFWFARYDHTNHTSTIILPALTPNSRSHRGGMWDLSRAQNGSPPGQDTLTAELLTATSSKPLRSRRPHWPPAKRSSDFWDAKDTQCLVHHCSSICGVLNSEKFDEGWWKTNNYTNHKTYTLGEDQNYSKCSFFTLGVVLMFADHAQGPDGGVHGHGHLFRLQYTMAVR